MQIVNALIFPLALLLTTTASPINASMIQQQTSLENNVFAGGQGTTLNPYLIENVTQLKNIRNFLEFSFRLKSDINFTKSDYSDSEKGWQSIINFTGTFDGNGYAIKNLFINRSNENNIGLLSFFHFR